MDYLLKKYQSITLEMLQLVSEKYDFDLDHLKEEYYPLEIDQDIFLRELKKNVSEDHLFRDKDKNLYLILSDEKSLKYNKIYNSIQISQ